jgi:hypothetical protein
LAPSSVGIGLDYFPVYWQNGVWGISPLSDPRLVKLSTQCPSDAEKKDIWKGRYDIFIKEQLLQKKTHLGNHVDQYLTHPKTKEKIIAVLKNSYLTHMGIVKGDEIINNLRSNREFIYTKETSTFLLNVLMIELFLQGKLKNIIKYSSPASL